MTRTSKFDDPPPGLRCPVCWHQGTPGAVGTISVCSICFSVFARAAITRNQRLAPSDLTRLPRDLVRQLAEHRDRLMLAAAVRWRSR
jgi:hypothetical protein